MAKIIISPGQALLMLIDASRDNPAKFENLKKLYLSGIKTQMDELKLKQLLKDEIFNNYEISADPQVINNDPVRRYFETHLSYETLKNQLKNISLTDLEHHYQALYDKIPEDWHIANAHVLAGQPQPNEGNPNKEFAIYIAQLAEGKIAKQLPEDKEKIALLVKLTYLSTLATMYHETTFPIRIYGTGIYSPANRGKEIILDQQTTRSVNAGNLKSSMSVPVGDIARTDEATEQLRPSDQARFVENAQWVVNSFKQQVHPFSNSISGTTLCQLRAMAQLQRDGDTTFSASTEKMTQYIQLYVATMLYFSGGHSLHEYTAPLAIDAVKAEFSTIPDFDRIDLESIFYSNNTKSIDEAIDDSIEYNKKILRRNEISSQIKGNEPAQALTQSTKALDFLNMKQQANQFTEQLITDIEERKHQYQQHVILDQSVFHTQGFKKLEIIQKQLEEVTRYINQDSPEKAKEILTLLKNDLANEFGKKNFYGKTKGSYKLVEELESELDKLIQLQPKFKDPATSFKMTLSTYKEEDVTPPEQAEVIAHGADEFIEYKEEGGSTPS